jgi:hypothetical protein
MSAAQQQARAPQQVAQQAAPMQARAPQQATQPNALAGQMQARASQEVAQQTAEMQTSASQQAAQQAARAAQMQAGARKAAGLPPLERPTGTSIATPFPMPARQQQQPRQTNTVQVQQQQIITPLESPKLASANGPLRKAIALAFHKVAYNNNFLNKWVTDSVYLKVIDQRYGAISKIVTFNENVLNRSILMMNPHIETQSTMLNTTGKRNRLAFLSTA